MRTLFLIVLVLLAFSCKTEKKMPVVTINVLSETPEMKNLSELASDIEYIPLETRPEALMRFVNYLKVTDEKFYINTVLELLCFDRNGRFLYKLAQQGRGPVDYTYLSDYDINPGKSQIIVLTGDKINFYNETATGLQFLKKVDVQMHPRYCDFIPGQDNILLSYGSSSGENKFQCIVINQEGDTLAKRPNCYSFTRNTKVVMGFSSDNVINRIDESIRIKGFLTDTVFTMTSDYQFIPYVILNTEGKGLTPDFLANVPATNPEAGSPIAAFLMLSEVLETDSYLLCRYFFQKQGTWVVYDKNSGDTRHFDAKVLLKDDISGGINIEPKFCYGGMLYSWTDALTFKKYMNEHASDSVKCKNPDRAASLRKMAESIKEDDNHILIAIKPKNP